MLALSRRAAMREAPHGFTHPKREHGSRTPKARTVHPTTERSQSGKNDLAATESRHGHHLRMGQRAMDPKLAQLLRNFDHTHAQLGV